MKKNQKNRVKAGTFFAYFLKEEVIGNGSFRKN
jgi:hypothetical protein